MKRPIVISLLAVMLFGLASCGHQEIKKTGLVKLSSHVYAMIASGPTPKEGLGANSGFVVGAKGVLVVDSRYTPALASELLKAIRSVTNAPIKYVVNTSYHPDHTWGNSVFKAEGATIIARPETRAAFVKYSPVYLGMYTAPGAQSVDLLKDVTPVAPDTTFARDETEIDLGGVKAVLRYFGPAQTAGDCVVVVPKGKIAFAGELVSNGYHPNMGDPGADFDNWLTALDRLGSVNVEHIVPGRGAVCGKEALEADKDYIRTLEKLVIDDIQKLTPFDQAVRVLTVPGTGNYLQDNLLPFNIQAVYRHEIPKLVQPDFAFDLPEGFQIIDGGGTTQLGLILWGGRSKDGDLELEVQWKPSTAPEVILQDIADQVARSEEVGTRVMVTVGSKRIDVGGEKALAEYGDWKYKKELGMIGGGVWTWATFLRNGKLYSIRYSTDSGLDAQREKRSMDFLEKIVSTFKVVKK